MISPMPSATANSVAHAGDHAGHLRIRNIHHALVRQQHLEQRHPQQAGSGKAAERSQQHTPSVAEEDRCAISRYPAPPNHVTNASTVNAFTDEIPLPYASVPMCMINVVTHMEVTDMKVPEPSHSDRRLSTSPVAKQMMKKLVHIICVYFSQLPC